MNPKKYIREEPDGIHWPDADVGDDLYYGVNFQTYLSDAILNVVHALQNEIIVNVTWTIPNGLISSDEFIEEDVGIIKLASNSIGTFKVICDLETVSSAKTQNQIIVMVLTVY